MERKDIRDMTLREVMKRYPCLTAHIIAESLGYATPSMAACILRDAKLRERNYCEWIHACYNGNALEAVRDAIKNRHRHKGFMCDYRLAKKIVDRAVETGEEPIFASWF